jgi:putative ABC transport system substrate-binding protein
MHFRFASDSRLNSAAGTQAARAAQQATKSIPIVMVASNPIGNGLVESLAHPGGNITGMSLLTPEAELTLSI